MGATRDYIKREHYSNLQRNEERICRRITPTGSYPITLSSTADISNLETKPRISEINLQASQNVRDVFKYEAEWMVSTLSWSNDPTDKFHLAVGSYIQSHTNYIELLTLAEDSPREEIFRTYSFEHPYPATKMIWTPKHPNNVRTQLPPMLATSANYLRIWKIDLDLEQESLRPNSHLICREETKAFDDDNSSDKVKLVAKLDAEKFAKPCGPISSFDWNEVDPNLLITTSIDSIISVWDLETQKLVINSSVLDREFTYFTKLGHDLRYQMPMNEYRVFDISFSRSGSGREIFVTCGSDSIIKVFDLRRPFATHRLYAKNNLGGPISRVSCNKQNDYGFSALELDSKEILMFDLRNPRQAVARLTHHTDSVNAMSWSPQSSQHMCSASDDHDALVWEVSRPPQPTDKPVAIYTADGPINTISWSTSHEEWLALGYKNCVELVRV